MVKRHLLEPVLSHPVLGHSSSQANLLQVFEPELKVIAKLLPSSISFRQRFSSFSAPWPLTDESTVAAKRWT